MRAGPERPATLRAARLRAAAAGLAVTLAACASSPLVPVGEGFRDPARGFELGRPPGEWRAARVPGAALAFRSPGGAWLSFAPHCGRRTGPAWVMARHLRLAIPEHRVRVSGPLTEGPGEAWREIFDVREDEATVRVETVTWVAGRCVFDWALAARDGFEAARPAFDAWRASFRWNAPPAAPPGAAAPGDGA